MSFEALQERLGALQETTSQLKELIDRLANLEFQPGLVPLGSSSDDGNEDNAAAELSTEINQTLREEEEELELLQEEITDLRSGRPGSEAEHSKARLRDGAMRLGRELKSCRVSFRKAQLSARRSLEQAQRLERELLLASYSYTAAAEAAAAVSSAASTSPDDNNNNNNNNHSGASSPTHQNSHFPPTYLPRRKAKSSSSPEAERGADPLLTASRNITSALRRTHTLIASELARSAFAQQILAESTEAMKSLQENYASLDDLLASSKNLLSTLVRSQKSDTWYLQTALAICAATLAWLVFRRWLYGPLWWIIWLPVRTVWKTGVAVSRIGDGAKMEPAIGMGMEKGAEVVGMPEEGAVPTVRTRRDGREESVDRSTMVEKVGRLVDEMGVQMNNQEKDMVGEKGGENSTEGQQQQQQPERNPMKRMWEEEKEAEKEAERVKDEL